MVTATTYPVVAPVAGVAFLVVAVRGWRAGRRRAVALTAVVVAAGLFPPVLPYTSSLGAAGGLGSADLLSLPGGLVQVSYAVVAALVLLAAAALRTDGTRRRMAAAWGPAVTAAVVTAAVTGLNLRAVGQIGYYADKSMYVVCALLVPAAAAGAAVLVTRPPRIRVVAAGLAGLALVVVVAAVDPRVPRDPMGTVQAAARHRATCARSEGSTALSWVDGGRVVAAARDGAGWGGRAVLPLGSVVGPERLVPGNREIEGYWIDVLAPSHAASARLMSYLARDAATLPQVMCSLAVFASHHDGLAVVAVADTPGQAAAARDALDGCRQGRATAVAVETLDLPPAPWYLRGEPDPGVR